MRMIVIILFLVMEFNGNAQKGEAEIIEAETSFAAFAVAHGTKAAFLKYLDSSAVVFEQGKPVNGIALWQSRPERQGILNWHPQFVEIAGSGDLGYTTGPWTFQPKTTKDSIVARGQFNSIWRKNQSGDWKNVFDIGTSAVVNDEKGIKIIKIKKLRLFSGTVESLLFAEKDFNKRLNRAPVEAYNAYGSKQHLIVNRNGEPPAISADMITRVITNISAGLKYTIGGYGMSKNGDLAYVYGTAEADNKKSNYLHVWRNENDGWKLALDVIH